MPDNELLFFRNDQWLRRDAAPSDAAPSDAAPSDAAPSDAAPSDAAPSDAAPSDAAPSDIVTLGITPFGAEELGELVFAELPVLGARISAGSPVGVVESVKAVAEILSPVAGIVVESNAAVAQNPGLVNESPLGEGWIVRLQIAGEWPADAMSEAQYAAFRSLAKTRQES